jgi:hypothetical protein
MKEGVYANETVEGMHTVSHMKCDSMVPFRNETRLSVQGRLGCLSWGCPNARPSQLRGRVGIRVSVGSGP